MTDDEFVAQFETTTLAEFPHASHIRLAWLYLRRYGYDGALERLLQGIRRFAIAKGSPEKFHYTLTRAWLDLVAAAAAATPEAPDAHALMDACPHLRDSQAVHRRYPPGVLDTPEARAGWVAAPQPRLGCRPR